MGGEHYLPQIEGIDLPHVINVSEADLRKKPLGRRIVMCGGGLSGSECSIDLACEGHDVTIVDALPQSELLRDVMDLVRNMIIGHLDELEIKTKYNCKVRRITNEGVEIEDESGGVSILEADTVITAFGLKSNKEIEAFLDIAPRTVVVGDSNNIGNIYSANTDAFNLTVCI